MMPLRWLRASCWTSSGFVISVVATTLLGVACAAPKPPPCPAPEVTCVCEVDVAIERDTKEPPELAERTLPGNPPVEAVPLLPEPAVGAADDLPSDCWTPLGCNAPAPGAAKRTVVFRVWPGAAQLRMDGREVNANTRYDVALGTHQLEAAGTCCKRFTGTFEAVAPTTSGPQVVLARLELEPARAKLTGAPVNGHVTCDNGMVLRADRDARVAVSNVVTQTRCWFHPTGASRSVMLAAGGPTMIEWPGHVPNVTRR